MSRLRAVLARLRPELSPLLHVSSLALAGPTRGGVSVRDRLDDVLMCVDAETDPARIVRMGTAAIHLDRLSDLREFSWRVVRQGGTAAR